MNMSEARLKYFEEQEKILSKVSKEYSSSLVGSKRERYFSDLIYTSCELGERETQVIKIINSLATKEAQLANKGKAKEKKLELKEEHIRNFKMKIVELLLKDIEQPVESNDDTKEPVEEPKNEPVEANNDDTKEPVEEPVESNDGTIKEKVSIVDYNLNSAYKKMKQLDINLPSKEKFKKMVIDCKFYMRDISHRLFNVNNKGWKCTPVVVSKKEDYHKVIKNISLYKNKDVQNLVKKLNNKTEQVIDAFEKVGCFLYGCEGTDLSSQIILSNMKTNEAYIEMTKKYNKDYNTREELLIDLLKNIE